MSDGSKSTASGTDDAQLLAWGPYAAEFIGTALLVAVGLSFVILDFGTGSPVVRLVPSAGARRAITGFLFGTTGGLIALSPLGKESGGHINPVVTLAFYLLGKFRPRHTLGYIAAQFAGAVVGALPLLLWGAMGRSVDFGATEPGPGVAVGIAVLGEAATTIGLIVGLFLFLRHRKLRTFTPALFPFLYAFMVWAEAPLSGTSTNPARSLGPVVISGVWRNWWVYFVGPVVGTIFGVSLFRFTWLKKVEIEVAKLFHFEHDPHKMFS